MEGSCCEVTDKAKTLVKTWPERGSSNSLEETKHPWSGSAGRYVVCSVAVFSSHLGQKALEKQKEDKQELDSLGPQLQLDPMKNLKI